MSVFNSTDELTQVMRSLWERLRDDPEVAPKLLESRLIVRFRYRDPEGTITIDCSDGRQCKILNGSDLVKPVVEMSMKADVAHDFWMGRMSVPMALLTGKIVSKGPTARALKLLPAIKSAFKIYPEVLKAAGKDELLGV